MQFAFLSNFVILMTVTTTEEPLLRGHPNEWPIPLERPLVNVDPNLNVLISTPDKRSPLLKGLTSQEGFPYLELICFLLFFKTKDEGI